MNRGKPLRRIQKLIQNGVHLLRWPCLVGAASAAFIALGPISETAHAAGLSDLVNGRFVNVPTAELPSGPATYYDATCPSESRCYAVGVGLGGGVLTTTADRGQTWTSSALPSTQGLANFAISCPSAQVCYVAGTNLDGSTVMLVTRTGGRTWSLDDVPGGSTITSIGCASTRSCLAVGSDITNKQNGSVIATTDGGAIWESEAVPISGLTTVRCIDLTHCWAAGPGAWFTSDLGASWRNLSPPSSSDCPTSGFGVCTAIYSETIDIEFQSDSDGWVVGGDQCGGQRVTQCAGIAIHTTDGGASWTASKGSANFPFNWQIACHGATCVLVGQAFSHSVIASTVNAGASWAQMQQVPTEVYALACTPARSLCIAAGGRNNVPALLTLGSVSTSTSPAPPSLLSTVGGSLASPATLLAAPVGALVNALVTVALILFVVFPSQLFNRTYDENHDRIRGWWEQRFLWAARLWRTGEHVQPLVRTIVSGTLVLVVGGVFAAMLDPRFGPNLRSLALFLGAVFAIVAGVAVSAVAAGVYRLMRHKVGVWHVRALPSALLIAAVCVLISRLTDFQPGYLYGLIGGVVFTGRLNRREEGHEVAVSTVGTLIVSIAAWLLWVPVQTASASHPTSFALALLENFFAALFLSGMVGLVIGLVPLRFLPGERLAAWHAGVWTALFGLVVFSTIEVIVQPQTHAASGGRAPIWLTAALFVGFGGASVLFWFWFKIRTRSPGLA
ncbi:MAG TPA: FGLLP motif-containing membrane protein [Candidatus Saccharimonadales bacterium]|nr:FGLLP motif-containing membrane protein [Candidatus Saccharimonadales bacterium]